MKARKLVISPALRRMILAEAARCAPEEACGLVGGRNGRAELVLPVENCLHSSTRFEMEPRALVRGLQRIEDEEKLELAAIYHSHPSGPRRPSETDRAEFLYPEAAMIIAAPDEKGAWKLDVFWMY